MKMLNPYRAVRSLNASFHAAGLAGTVAQFDNVGTHSQYRIAYEKTARYVSAGSSVLDWGCGNGHFSLFLETLGARVTGYSFEDPPACMAHSTTFRHVRGGEADPLRIPFEANTFDAVCGVGVLEHVWETGGDERVSLSEIARILKPGGVFLTYHLPNKGGWVERVAIRFNKPFHGRRYSTPEIRTLWDEAGLEILDVGRYNFLPRAGLRGLPSMVRHSDVFVRAYNLMDDTFTTLAPGKCTNYFVVGRKRARG